MRRRTVAILIALLGAAIAVFVFVPVVYSPITVGEGAFCVQPHCSTLLVSYEPAYESPSCAVFGVGTTYDNFLWSVGWGVASSYNVGCPPKVLVLN